MYEYNLGIIWQALYVCAQGASYPMLSSWRKSHFRGPRLGEQKKRIVCRGLCVEQCVKTGLLRVKTWSFVKSTKYDGSMIRYEEIKDLNICMNQFN